MGNTVTAPAGKGEEKKKKKSQEEEEEEVEEKEEEQYGTSTHAPPGSEKSKSWFKRRHQKRKEEERRLSGTAFESQALREVRKRQKEREKNKRKTDSVAEREPSSLWFLEKSPSSFDEVRHKHFQPKASRSLNLSEQEESGFGTWYCLPAEAKLQILSYLPPTDLSSIACCSRSFFWLSSDDMLWKSIYQETDWLSVLDLPQPTREGQRCCWKGSFLLNWQHEAPRRLMRRKAILRDKIVAQYREEEEQLKSQYLAKKKNLEDLRSGAMVFFGLVLLILFRLLHLWWLILLPFHGLYRLFLLPSTFLLAESLPKLHLVIDWGFFLCFRLCFVVALGAVLLLSGIGLYFGTKRLFRWIDPVKYDERGLKEVLDYQICNLNAKMKAELQRNGCNTWIIGEPVPRKTTACILF
ncbi:hypothetical protein QOT17_005294 [Balamuthia mandrillaris]